MGENQSVATDPQALAQASSFSLGISATTLSLSRPRRALLVEEDGVLHIADEGNGLVLAVTEANGIARPIVGSLDADDDPPSSDGDPPRSVRLDRPTGLARDELGSLYIANSYRVDEAGERIGHTGGNVLVLESTPAGPFVRELVPNGLLEQPVALAYHDFAAGERTLFILDAGRLDDQPGAKPRPRIWSLDVELGASSLTEVSLGQELTFEPDVNCGEGDPDCLDPYVPRCLRDLHLVPRPGGSAGIDLFVVGDFNDHFREFLFTADPGNERADFEQDCHDGIDQGGGGIDAADPDCQRPLRELMLRLPFDANGSPGETGHPDVRALKVVRGFKRFRVAEVNFDAGCGPPPAAVSGVDIGDLVLSALTFDATGNVALLVDACRGDVTAVELDMDYQPVRFFKVAGSTNLGAVAFDGGRPLSSRFARPGDILLDRESNLYVVDTLNNRIRRVWIGDELRFQ